MSSQKCEENLWHFFVKSYAVGYIHVQYISLHTNPSIVSRGLKTDVSATKRALTTVNPMKLTGQMPKLLMPPPSSISIATWRAGTSVDNSSLWTGREVHYHQSMTSWTCMHHNHQPAESPPSPFILFPYIVALFVLCFLHFYCFLFVPPVQNFPALFYDQLNLHTLRSSTSWVTPLPPFILFMPLNPSTSRQTSSSRRDNWTTSYTPLMLTPSTNSKRRLRPSWPWRPRLGRNRSLITFLTTPAGWADAPNVVRSGWWTYLPGFSQRLSPRFVEFYAST